MKQSFLLYGHGGCGNRGCEAIVRGTHALLREAGADASLTLCSERPDEDRGLAEAGIVDRVLRHGVTPYSWDRVCASLAYRLRGQEAYAERTQGRMLRAARRADVCLSIGGDTYCYNPPEALYAINRRLVTTGKRFALWGCSVDPERLEGAVLADLRRYGALFARESITHQAMLDAGLAPTRAADPAFALPMEQLPLPPGFAPGNTVGFNISPLALKHAKADVDALEASAALIRHILRATDCAVALVPHVRWSHDDDLQTLGALKERFSGEPRVLLLDPALTAPQLKGYIAQMRCLIAARTHATIAAYATGVPTLVLGYSVKARGIARDLYGEETGHVLPVQELASAAELTSAFDALLKREEAEREALREALPGQLALARAAVDTLIKWAEARA